MPVADEVDGVQPTRFGDLNDCLANLSVSMRVASGETRVKTHGTVGAVLDNPVSRLQLNKFREHVVRRRRVHLRPHENNYIGIKTMRTVSVAACASLSDFA